jgi:hypothetical protein
MSDVYDLKRKYCVGFDLKNKCEVEEDNTHHMEKLKELIK